MSFGGLRIGSSGLAAAQRALETSAHNVANANTAGFSRQRVEVGANRPLLEHRGPFGPGATGQGVGVEVVGRAHDALVSANHRETSSQYASWNVRADYFARAEQVLGPLDDGATAALSAFWNSWEALSQSPDSMTSRNQVLYAGRELAGSINDANARLTDLRDEIGLDIASTVSEVNRLATEVAHMNKEIKAARAAGNQPNDLLDSRDQALGDLARLTGAQVLTQHDGDARVTLAGIPIVDGDRASQLEAAGVPPTVQWTASGEPAALAGELGSLSEVAGPVTDDLLAQLDTIATELRDMVNTAHQAGFGLDGVSGRNFFSGTSSADLAVDAAVTTETIAASASGAATDGNHALVIGGLRTAAGASGGSTRDLVNALQGSLGLEASHAASQRDLAAIVASETASMLAEVTGVSTDEELTDMLRYQRAYEASARVITVIDQLLDRLINGTGATR